MDAVTMIVGHSTFSTSSSLLLRTVTPVLSSRRALPHLVLLPTRHHSPWTISTSPFRSSSSWDALVLRSQVAGVADDGAEGSTPAPQTRNRLETVGDDGNCADGLSRRRGKRGRGVGMAPKRLVSDEEDVGFMRAALAEARSGAEQGEVPVGAVLVHNKKIISRFHNQVEATGDPTAHAEMLCIRSAAAQLGGWRLTDVSMYVTLEPCPMCAGAILQGRVSELVWGARNSLLGADGSWIKLFPVSPPGECEPEGKDNLHPFHRTITVRRGVLAEESAEIMQSFFARRRLQPKSRIDDAHEGVRYLGWFPPSFRKLNSWVSRWLQS